MSRRKASIWKRGPAAAQINLTPMIDMTFNLIVFFVLTINIGRTELAEEIELPRPLDAVASNDPAEEHRLTVNLLPAPEDPARVARLRLGFREFPPTTEGLSQLLGEMKTARVADEQLRIELRADRRTAYREVFPILRLAAASGARQVNLVVQPGEQEESDGGTDAARGRP